MQIFISTVHCTGVFSFNFRKNNLHNKNSIYVRWNENSMEYGPDKTKIE